MHEHAKKKLLLLAVTQVALVAAAATGITGDAMASAYNRNEVSVIVIVHPSNLVDEISAKKLSSIFLRKVRSWNNGVPIQPVDLKRGGTREEFSKAVHGKGPRVIKQYWQRKLLTGRDIPPPELTSTEAVISFVLSSPGAIGYVSADADVGEARVLKIME